MQKVTEQEFHIYITSTFSSCLMLEEREGYELLCHLKKTVGVREIMARIISDSQHGGGGKRPLVISGPSSSSSRTTVTYTWFPRIMTKWPFRYLQGQRLHHPPG